MLVVWYVLIALLLCIELFGRMTVCMFVLTRTVGLLVNGKNVLDVVIDLCVCLLVCLMVSW